MTKPVPHYMLGVASRLAIRQARRDRVAELERLGVPPQEMAKGLQVSIRTIARDRQYLGFTRAPNEGMSSDEIERARALLEDGATYTEAARSIGRRPKVVKNRLPGYHVCDRREVAQLAALGRKWSRLKGEPLEWNRQDFSSARMNGMRRQQP